MAIPWLVVLQNVPWAEVVKNAPKVADGAKKLWNAVGRKSPIEEPAQAATAADATAEAQSVPALFARVAALESSMAKLHEQMLASSELIKSLADQNTQLVARIEANRTRVAWLTAATVVFALLAILGLGLALLR
ncbi:MAG: hypothetical protein AB7O31_08205 [Burkholderiales bacterium]